MIKKEITIIEKFELSEENKKEIAKKSKAIKKELMGWGCSSVVELNDQEEDEEIVLGMLASAGVNFVTNEYYQILGAIQEEGCDTFFKEIDDIIKNSRLTVEDFESLRELKKYLLSIYNNVSSVNDVIDKIANKDIKILNVLLD